MNKHHAFYTLTMFTLIATATLTSCSSQQVSDIKTIPTKFSLIEEGKGTEIKNQSGGTCWVTSASSSMESSLLMSTGENVSISPMDILNQVYDETQKEGFIPNPSTDIIELGGWSQQIIGSLSNGFGDYILEDATDFSFANTNQIKEAIMTYGAMNVATNDNRAKMGNFSTYTTMNDPYSDDFDHEVIIIGWDDEFSKEYFKEKPQQDGAWLVQNSYSDTWGDNGTYWISYESPLREQTIFRLSNEYSDVLSYDGGYDGTISLGDSTITGNVFNHKGKLSAVGTYTTDVNQELIIDIYDGEFTELITSYSTTIDLPGYHIIKLPETYDVEHFSIVINYSGTAPVEGQEWQDEYIHYKVDSNEGESFVYYDNQWLDLSLDSTKEILELDFEPNNCCIKAIFSN